jgi:hypothetical protein
VDLVPGGHTIATQKHTDTNRYISIDTTHGFDPG